MDYVLFFLSKVQDTRYDKCFQPGGFTQRGWFLLVLVGGYIAGQGKGMSPGSSGLLAEKS